MISEIKRRALEERMRSLGIQASDLEEHFIRSSGAGGQNVNKVNSCVWLKHLPTGLDVKCQITRSQLENRYHARVILCEKFEEKFRQKESKAARERHRIRKQKKKRSKRTKEKMLKDKAHRSVQKSLRSRVTED